MTQPWAREALKSPKNRHCEFRVGLCHACHCNTTQPCVHRLPRPSSLAGAANRLAGYPHNVERGVAGVAAVSCNMQQASAEKGPKSLKNGDSGFRVALSQACHL